MNSSPQNIRYRPSVGRQATGCLSFTPVDWPEVQGVVRPGKGATDAGQNGTVDWSLAGVERLFYVNEIPTVDI